MAGRSRKRRKTVAEAFGSLSSGVGPADAAASEERGQLASARFALRTLWGFDDYRPTQRGVVRAALRGDDCLVVMPTGGGKSLCFQIPAVVDAGVTVVCPP